MKKKLKSFGLIGALLLIAGAMLAFRIYEHNHPQQFQTNEEIQRENGVPVEVVPVERRNITNQELFSGTIEGFSQTQVISDISQKLIALKVRVGSRVSRDDTIAVLDTKNISNANLHYAQTAANFEDAKLTYQRMKNLFDAGAIAKQDFDRARLNYDIQKANFESVKSAVYIASPIAGVVTETYVEPGDKINTGQAIAKIVRFDKVKIKIQVNESDIALVKKGQRCEISTASFDQEFTGEVSEISLSADPRSRNFEVTVAVENPNLQLRAGMFARVRIVFDNRSEALTVHKDALLKNGSDLFVYTVNNENAISQKAVKVGITDGQYYEVLAGLSLGETVIIEGYTNIQSNDQKAIIIK